MTVGADGHRFYLLGMGNRRKLLYRDGRLLDAMSGEALRQWDVAGELIEPSEYRVTLRTRGGEPVRITEDADGVWLEERGAKTSLASGPVMLPRFDGHPRAALLRALHQEILINIVAGRPVPNLLAYPTPWYRDAAMMLMCLAKTGNLSLIADWVAGLREPFDRNNGGDREPDNLGEALYLISLVSDKSHPLVGEVLKQAARCRKGAFIVGPTDSAEHPVYQTKWLKWGLRNLGLDDPHEVPALADSYSSLFWMDYRDAHVPGPRFGDDAKRDYPYLAWAEAHFHGWAPPMRVDAGRYPLTWEANASQADYARMRIVGEEYADRRIAAPHGWHAAEMLLYFWEARE
jgi:hypothetical protein